MLKWSPVLFHRLLQLFFEPFLSGPEQFLFDNNQQGHDRTIFCVCVCNDCVLFVYSTWSWKPLPPPALFMGDSFKFTCEMWRLWKSSQISIFLQNFILPFWSATPSDWFQDLSFEVTPFPLSTSQTQTRGSSSHQTFLVRPYHRSFSSSSSSSPPPLLLFSSPPQPPCYPDAADFRNWVC